MTVAERLIQEGTQKGMKQGLHQGMQERYSTGNKPGSGCF